ncbi:Asp-tRNA(Asn)/Glu-tRNA(Gln) amidotransferase subunit GatC [Anaerorhabdus furcosa]|uniref:Aspartyl/glutamyl-tRNA(Asn/Gln) amidotransferase subunit C n=1 Tax=Anaerorhabdus furcosa TaxID=118967 RepID=A0A1T4JUD3_9FIRM|nr:Asp-tRNA(Asn)/Glu-tRNA(Gln) amidotransferase subunit GatC [Anaerorhabdus furcosa]SJZ33832.1 aspartyl/glutamyl-tRNA(Asn/Gln) amidotransferase subunit C [Anaerorhabdus furcosa]
MTEIKSKEYLRHLAHQCMFDCSDDELDEIQEEFMILEKQMELLNQVDTEGVEPMVYPFEMETTFLRMDEVVNVLSEEEALANAAKTKNGHILVPKVVR